MINMSFTQQELHAMIQLMDLAVKSGGLQVAPAAVVLQQKIMAAVQAAATPAEEVTVEA